MWSCVLAGALLAAPQVEVQTFSGQDASGALVELSPEQVVLSSGGQSKTIKVEDLLAVQFSAASQSVDRAIHVVLVDGSLLISTGYQVADGKATVKLASGEELTISTRELAHVRFQLGESYNAQWEEILARERASDRIVIRKDDALDFLDGVLGTVDDRISFDPGGGVVRVKPDKVFAIVYYHKAGREFPKTVCMLEDSTGSRLAAAELKLDGDVFKVKTATGVELTRAIDSVKRLDYSQGKIVYLSDLTPATKELIPFAGNANNLDEVFQPRFDRAIDGGPLTLDGRKYAKGLAVHCGTKLSYRLGGDFRRFQAVVGIDDSSKGGDVTLQLISRDRVLYTGSLTGKDKPRGKVVDLDVTGVQVLTIFLPYEAFPIDSTGDHVDLCNARLIK